jgi:hypothetical protein
VLVVSDGVTVVKGWRFSVDAAALIACYSGGMANGFSALSLCLLSCARRVDMVLCDSLTYSAANGRF